jgi:membrane protein
MKKIKGFMLVILALLAEGLISAASKGRSGSNRQGPTQAKEGVSYGGADSPGELPKHGWKLALKRTKEALKDKNLPVSAAGVAYYATLTFFPAVLGVATIYATIADPRGLLGLLESLQGLVPDAIYDMLETQLTPLAEAGRKSVGVAALLSVAALLWTTSGGLQNLVKALNEAYDVRETRGFIKLRTVNVLLSIFLLAFGGLIMGTIILEADALQQWGVSSLIADSFAILRWPMLVILISIVLAVVYRYAPNREEPHWSWVSWGATAATIIWLAATAAFFYYAQNFGNFNKTYGTFAGIIILMTWFNVSSLVVLLGGQVNKKLEEVTGGTTHG